MVSKLYIHYKIVLIFILLIILVIGIVYIDMTILQNELSKK